MLNSVPGSVPKEFLIFQDRWAVPPSKEVFPKDISKFLKLWGDGAELLYSYEFDKSGSWLQEHIEMLKSLRRNHDCSHLLLYWWAATLPRSNLQGKPVISSLPSDSPSLREAKKIPRGRNWRNHGRLLLTGWLPSSYSFNYSYTSQAHLLPRDGPVPSYMYWDLLHQLSIRHAHRPEFPFHRKQNRTKTS